MTMDKQMKEMHLFIMVQNKDYPYLQVGVEKVIKHLRGLVIVSQLQVM